MGFESFDLDEGLCLEGVEAKGVPTKTLVTVARRIILLTI
jgi:hypothetical protein